MTDAEVEEWIADISVDDNEPGQQQEPVQLLFAYPGQSNMTGRRLPREWYKIAKQLTNHCALTNKNSPPGVRSFDKQAQTKPEQFILCSTRPHPLPPLRYLSAIPTERLILRL